MKSLIFPSAYLGSSTTVVANVQVFTSQVGTIAYATSGTPQGVAISLSGASTSSVTAAVTDATDAATVQQQINAALDSSDSVTVIAGNPAAPSSAPTGLAAVGNFSSVNLSWNSLGTNPLLTYNIYRGNSAGSETLHASGIAGTSFVDPITTGLKYYYKISASYPRGQGPLSSEVSAAPGVPGTPSISSATPIYGGVSLVWTTVSGATYNLYINKSLFTSGIAITTYSVTGLKKPTTFQVSAVINGVEGALSSAVQQLPLSGKGSST